MVENSAIEGYHRCVEDRVEPLKKGLKKVRRMVQIALVNLAHDLNKANVTTHEVQIQKDLTAILEELIGIEERESDTSWEKYKQEYLYNEKHI